MPLRHVQGSLSRSLVLRPKGVLLVWKSYIAALHIGCNIDVPEVTESIVFIALLVRPIFEKKTGGGFR